MDFIFCSALSAFIARALRARAARRHARTNFWAQSYTLYIIYARESVIFFALFF